MNLIIDRHGQNETSQPRVTIHHIVHGTILVEKETMVCRHVNAVTTRHITLLRESILLQVTATTFHLVADVTTCHHELIRTLICLLADTPLGNLSILRCCFFVAQNIRSICAVVLLDFFCRLAESDNFDSFLHQDVRSSLNVCEFCFPFFWAIEKP